MPVPARAPCGAAKGHGVQPAVLAAGPGDPGALALAAEAGAAPDAAGRVGCTVGRGSSEATSTDGLLGSGEHGTGHAGGAGGAGAGAGAGAGGGAGRCGGGARQGQGNSAWSVWGAGWFGPSSGWGWGSGAGVGAGGKAAAVPAVGPGPGGSFPLPQVVHDETSLWQQYKGEHIHVNK